MKKVLLAISIIASATAFAQATKYDGNGKEGFGGAIGKGSFEIMDKGDSVCFLLTKGPSTFDSLVVFYLDGIDGGISNTANLPAGTDIYSTAVTGNYSSTQKSVLNFHAGFQPDFSVVFNKDGGRIYFFEKDNEGNDVAMPGADVVLTPIGTNASQTYSGTIAKADVSVTGPVSFKLIASYIGAKAFRSNEGIGDNFSAFDNANGYASYTTESNSNFSSFTSLPVTLTAFKATLVNDKAHVQWQVAQEVNIDEYQIQHSTNGVQFTTISIVKAGNTSASSTYSAIVNATKGTNYYRLIIKEKDRTQISKVIALKNGSTKNQFKVAQSGKQLIVMLDNVVAGKYQLTLINANGQVLQTEAFIHNGVDATKQLSIKSNIIKGIYTVVLQSEKTKASQNILLQ